MAEHLCYNQPTDVVYTPSLRTCGISIKLLHQNTPKIVIVALTVAKSIGKLKEKTSYLRLYTVNRTQVLSTAISKFIPMQAQITL